MRNQTVTNIEISKIKPDPQQPRQEFDPVEMDRLEKSIAVQGILMPLAVEKQNGNFLIIDGERRFRSAIKLRLKTVPAVIYDKMQAQDRLVTRFHLQEQHANWSAFDKAKAMYLLQEATGMSQKEIAGLLGMNLTTISGYFDLLNLSKRSMHTANESKIPFTYLRNIGHILSKIDDMKTKQKVETALIQKIQARVITKASDMTHFQTAITHGGDKVIKQIVRHADFTAKQAMKLAGADKIVAIKKIVTNANWFTSVLRRGTEVSAFKALEDNHVKSLQKLIDTAQKFISLAGYVEPKNKIRAKTYANGRVIGHGGGMHLTK